VLSTLYDFYNELKQDGIIFCFSGPVSQSIVEGIGETLRHKMELDEAGMGASQRVFAIFVEQMQNVLNYSAERLNLNEGERDLSHGVVIVGRQDQGFYVLSGNYVYKDISARLGDMLTRLRGMDKEALKAFFKEQRRKDPHESSKGAGLGLIDICRKASRPVEFHIKRVDDALDFFSLKAVI